MATKKTQRWAILIIMIVTVVGTLGSFAVMVLASQNQSQEKVAYQEALSRYQKEAAEYQKKLDAQTAALSKKYYAKFAPYSSKVGKYSIDSVKKLTTADLSAGDGAKIDGSTKFAAYYIGWDANGNVFDQSIDKSSKKLKAPLPIDGLDTASLIAGWKEGMKGMRIGGVRLITIPSDKAYGEQGSTDGSGNQTIAPNMPLKFVVMAIPAPEEIPQPDTSELIKYQSQGYY